MHVRVLFRIIAGIMLLQHTVAASALPNRRKLSNSEQSEMSLNDLSFIQKRRQDQWLNFLTPGGFKVSYITFANFIPVQLAAIGLQELYQAVMDSAMAYQVTAQAPSNSVVITIGNFTLTLSSSQEIPWVVVYAFAAKMWILSSFGFTPGYTIILKSPRGSELRANLEVRDS